MIRLLTFSNLYPNACQPQHGIFVEQRLRHLVATGEVESRVVAPVPWLPLSSAGLGPYALQAGIPERDRRHGIEIDYPRYLNVPKVGMSAAPYLMTRAVSRLLHRLASSGPGIDAIDAHYFYPDGVAAARLAGQLGLPVVITARGTDINLIPRYRIARSMILEAADRAAAIIAVSEALKDEMIRIGIDGDKVTVLRNGVDLELFRPMDRDDARARADFDGGRWLLSVGHLIERKGHHLILDALVSMPECRLAIVGTGPMEHELKTQAARLGIDDRVRFVGSVEQVTLPVYYSAADALVLASSREGMANVLLEALACGTPVVATPIWGTPEVVRCPEAGVLTRDRSADAIAAATAQLFDNYPERRATRRYAEAFGWDDTTQGQIDIFTRVRR